MFIGWGFSLASSLNQLPVSIANDNFFYLHLLRARLYLLSLLLMINVSFAVAFFSGINAESRLSCPLPDQELLLIHGSATLGSTVQYQCASG